MKIATLKIILLILALCVSRAAGAPLTPGAGRFEVEREGKAIPVWYYLPEAAGADAPVLIVMHGVNRDANRYRDEWTPYAREYGFILVAPEFSEAAFPGEGYTLGANGGYAYIEAVLDAVKAATGNRSGGYYLYGHSAGAQFVHRFLYAVPNARVVKAVAANAGWWTLPDPAVSFPYGLKGSSIDETALRTMLQRPLVVLLGTADTDPNHVHLRRTPEALAQGPHRFARGQTFFASGQSRATALGVPLGWQLVTAPGVAHSDSGMAVFAVKQLFGQPPITGRDPAHARVLFGGDTSAGESYQEEYAAKGGVNILAEKGYEHGLAQIRRLLAAVDFRVLNLETPLTQRRESPLKTKDYLHYSDPVKVPALFAPYGPMAASLANNHTLDQGAEGLDDTIAALAAAKMAWFGAGPNLAGAAAPLLQEFQIDGEPVTLAVFGAFEFRTEYDRDFHFYASAKRAGVAAADVPAVKEAIAELRRARPGVFVVYFVHWGDNYAWKNEKQVTMAHALREAGVDLVIGAHAHMMQEVEPDGPGWIFYGIGNFLFNARGRYAAHQAPPFSLPLVVDFSRKEGRLQVGLRAYPIVSDNQLTGYQPRFVTEAELATVESLLAEKSGWDATARAAVRHGVDEIGPWLEFGDLSQSK